MPNKPTAVHAKCVHLLAFNHWRPEMKAFSTYDTRAVDPNKWRAGWWRFIPIKVQPRGLSGLLEQSPLSGPMEMCMMFSSCDAKDINVYYDFFSQCSRWRYSSWDGFGLWPGACCVLEQHPLDCIKGPWDERSMAPRVATTHTQTVTTINATLYILH